MNKKDDKTRLSRNTELFLQTGLFDFSQPGGQKLYFSKVGNKL